MCESVETGDQTMERHRILGDKVAPDDGTKLPDRYWRFDRWWIALDSLAFPAVVVIIALMVMQPNL
jgi:uncharacterized membrane protein